MTGLSEQEFYNKYPDQQSFMMEYGGMVEKYKKGGWIQKATASIKRRGTEGKCTPMSKPGCTGRALALAKTFHKMAAKRKKHEDGGMVNSYAEGGETKPLTPEELKWLATSLRGIESSNYLSGKYPDNTMPGGTTDRVKNLSPEHLEQLKNYMSGTSFAEDFIQGITPNMPFFNPKPKNSKLRNGGMVGYYADGGKLPEGILRSRLEAHMSPAEAQDYINNYAEGGVVDVYQLMGMPTPSMYGMGGYAMGGPVNIPNGYQKNITFAMGGMTKTPTEINVEKGELLVDPKTGKILTEYKGGGMVPHPKYGMDERGTVPAQEGKFVIPVKYKMGGMTYAEAYKNAGPNDKLLRDVIMNNTAYRKAKSEAKEEAEMMAKYGGVIKRMMARGGMVPMYQNGGGAPGPRMDSGYFNFPNFMGAFPDQAPYMMEQGEDWSSPTPMGNPVLGMANYIAGLSPAQATPMMGRMPSTYQAPAAEPQYTYEPGPNQRGYQTNKPLGGRNPFISRLFGTGQEDGASAETGTSTPNSNQRMDNALMAAQFLPAGYNLVRGLFEKPWKPGSYETPADLKWRELTGEAGRRDLTKGRAAMEYAAKNIGGPNALSALTSGANQYYGQLAKYNEDLENINRQGQSQMDVRNKAIQQSNMQMRMQRDYLAQQAREKKAEMIGAGIGNIGSGAGQLWQNRQMMDALRIAYPQGINYKPGETTPITAGSTVGSTGYKVPAGSTSIFDTSRPSWRQIKSWG